VGRWLPEAASVGETVEVITIVICALGWSLGWWAMGRVRTVEDLEPTPGTGESVSIIIPARDEAGSLPNLLRDLDRQRPAGSEVIVVDDHSVDGTAALAAQFDFVRVVEASELPPGWTGKCWACWTGASIARGEVLVFLDADVRLDPGSLDRLLLERSRKGGLVSVQPWHSIERPYERLSALFNVVAVMGVGVDGRKEPAGAFGPLLVTSAADYHSVGGHRSVCRIVVEDLALAHRYQHAGLSLSVMAGGHGVRYRMYPDGIRQMVQGWTKHTASGARSTYSPRMAAIVVWVGGLGSAVSSLAQGLAHDIPLWLGVLAYLAFVAQLTHFFGQVGGFGFFTALVYPVLMLFFFAVFFWSIWRTFVRQQVSWRGRTIPVDVRGT